MTQGKLKLYPSEKKTNPDEIRMLEFLTSSSYWHTARQLQRICGWSDRKCREIAQHSAGKIISGQRGYKANVCATPDEINHASNWIWSQASEMVKRAVEIKRVAHENLKHKGVSK